MLKAGQHSGRKSTAIEALAGVVAEQLGIAHVVGQHLYRLVPRDLAHLEHAGAGGGRRSQEAGPQRMLGKILRAVAGRCSAPVPGERRPGRTWARGSRRRWPSDAGIGNRPLSQPDGTRPPAGLLAAVGGLPARIRGRPVGAPQLGAPERAGHAGRQQGAVAHAAQVAYDDAQDVAQHVGVGGVFPGRGAVPWLRRMPAITSRIAAAPRRACGGCRLARRCIQPTAAKRPMVSGANPASASAERNAATVCGSAGRVFTPRARHQAEKRRQSLA